MASHPWTCLPIALLLTLPPISLAFQESKLGLEEALLASKNLQRADKNDEASTLLKAALESASGDPYNQPKRYEALKQMFSLLSVTPQHAEAERYLQEAINHQEVTLASVDHPSLAPDLVELAMFCARTGDPKRGITTLDRVVSLLLKQGPPGEGVADAQSRKGELWVMAGQPEQAVGMWQSALAIRQISNGPESPMLLPILDHLGSTLATLRKYDQAVTRFQHALRIREQVFGPESSELIPTLDGLTYSLFGEKRYADAEPLYNRLLAIWKKSSNPEHPMVALTLDKMVVFYRAQEKWEQAQKAAEESLAIKEIFLASGLASQATFHVTRKDVDAAQEKYKRAIEVLVCQRPECAEHRKNWTQASVSLSK